MVSAATIPLLLVGAGGHAASCLDVVDATGHFRVVGLVGRESEMGASVGGYAVIGTDADLHSLRESVTHALVVVGQIKTPNVRLALFEQLQDFDFTLPVVTSPRAICSARARIGVGTIVMHGAIINTGTQVGVNCIINSRALLEHGVTVGDHCHISTAAVVNGDAVIGDGTFVGSGAVIREGVRIGRRCLIGMGAIVRHDLPDESVFYGTPHHGA